MNLTSLGRSSAAHREGLELAGGHHPAGAARVSARSGEGEREERRG